MSVVSAPACVLCVWCLLALRVEAQPYGAGGVAFEYLGSEDGLSHNTVYAVRQDTTGFLWLGTADGLNRYDGYGFDVFRYDPDDPHSLSNNVVTRLHVDRRGDLWVGTRNGLNRFDPARQTFVRYATSAVRAVGNYGEIYEMPPDSKMPPTEIAALAREDDVKVGDELPAGVHHVQLGARESCESA